MHRQDFMAILGARNPLEQTYYDMFLIAQLFVVSIILLKFNQHHFLVILNVQKVLFNRRHSDENNFKLSNQADCHL